MPTSQIEALTTTNEHAGKLAETAARLGILDEIRAVTASITALDARVSSEPSPAWDGWWRWKLRCRR